MKKYTLAEFIEKSKKLHGNKFDYSYIKEYKNNKEKLILLCNFCKNTFKVTPHNHFRGTNCPKCSKEELASKRRLTNEDFLKRAADVHENKYEYLENCKGYKRNIKIKCLKCNNIFSQQVYSHLRGNGCKKCAYKNNPQNTPFDPTIFENFANEIHSNRYNYIQDYKGINHKVTIVCKQHGNFRQEANAHLRGQGCPECSLSWGEFAITNILTKYNIPYIVQKKFDNCKHIKKLKFDFYLPDHNTCVEYDGQQHFVAVDYFGGQKTLEQNQIRDDIKNQFCRENNVKLIRISFKQIDDIENILIKNLNLKKAVK